MVNVIDLTGKKFGRLTVIKREPNKGVYPMWLCKCICGGEKVISGEHLRRGNTKSCGCLNKETVLNRLKPGVAMLRTLIRRYKNSAKRRGIEYKLTEEQFIKLTEQDCYYCGAKPNRIAKGKGYNGNYTYNGIDRIDNNKGYVINNVVPCCHTCNQAKSNLKEQEFKNWIERIFFKTILELEIEKEVI